MGVEVKKERLVLAMLSLPKVNPLASLI